MYAFAAFEPFTSRAALPRLVARFAGFDTERRAAVLREARRLRVVPRIRVPGALVTII